MALYLREAVEEDMDLLYEWANDAEVRKNAFHTEQIPYDTHKKWFENLLKDTETLQYILVEEAKAKEIGQIRLSLNKDRAVIDYSVDKHMRKRGFGVKMVKLVEVKLQETAKNITFLIGQVKYENAASARVFEKCGYKAYPQENYIEYRKQIR